MSAHYVNARLYPQPHLIHRPMVYV